MTIEEYRVKMSEAMSDPATAGDKMAEIMSTLSQDLAAKEKAEGDVAALTGNMAALQGKYNQLVVLGGRAGNPAGEAAGNMEHETPPTWADTMRTMAEELAGKENIYGAAH